MLVQLKANACFQATSMLDASMQLAMYFLSLSRGVKPDLVSDPGSVIEINCPPVSEAKELLTRARSRSKFDAALRLVAGRQTPEDRGIFSSEEEARNYISEVVWFHQ